MATKRSTKRQLSFTGSDDRTCSLCLKRHHQLSTPALWRSEQARQLVQSMQVRLDTYICKPCKDDITRVLANPNHVPRWTKGDKEKCCISNCRENVFTRGRLGSIQQIEAALEAIGLQTLADIPVPTPLCKQHYHQVYNLLQPTQTNCLNCGMSLRHASPSPRPCPNPVMIEKYLQDNTGFEGNVRAQDKVCFPCYKSFLVILLEHKPTSTDDDLQMLISTYSQQIPTTDDITTVNDVLDVAMIKTSVHWRAVA